jgi:NADH:ubiquinone oxidoreductase subunit C
VFSEGAAAKNRAAFVHVNRGSLRALLAMLRLEMLFFGSHLLDLTGFEQAPSFKRGGSVVTVVYLFFVARWGLKLVVNSRFFNWARLANVGEFFGGAVWPERECAELLGVNFVRKLDARRLMVDYTFEGAPLLKKFPVVGYEELEFNMLGRGLVYSVLRLRDEAEVAGA